MAPSSPNAFSKLIDQAAVEANGNVGHWLQTAAQAHRDGRVEDARALLLETLSRFPAEADPRVELARLEEVERNWIEAERCWREFAVLRPAVWWAPACIALALRKQGRMADARAVLAEALERFPEEMSMDPEPRLADNHSHFEDTLKARLAELAPEMLYRLGRMRDTVGPDGAPAAVVAEAPASSVAQSEEPPAEVALTQAPAKDDPWMRRAASLFGSKARY